MALFIPGKRLGIKFVHDPINPWVLYNANERTFLGDFKDSKIRSWYFLESTTIGKGAQSPKGEKDVFESEAGTTIQTYYSPSTKQMVQRRKTATVYGESWRGDSSKQQSTCLLDDSKASDPFFDGWAPNAWYHLWLRFTVVGQGKVKVSGFLMHGKYPDCEVILNYHSRDHLILKYVTPDKKADFFNLGTSTTSRIKPFIIDIDTPKWIAPKKVKARR